MSHIDKYSQEEIKSLVIEAKENKNLGNTINEDNAVYEMYPYQIRVH